MIWPDPDLERDLARERHDDELYHEEALALDEEPLPQDGFE